MARTAKRKSLKAWGEAVRSCGKCEVCGIGVVDTGRKISKGRRKGQAVITKLDAHHILFKERYPEFQTEPLNGICLCTKCHRFHKFSFHKNPIWSTMWLRRNRPELYEWAKTHIGEPEYGKICFIRDSKRIQ